VRTRHAPPPPPRPAAGDRPGRKGGRRPATAR